MYRMACLAIMIVLAAHRPAAAQAPAFLVKEINSQPIILPSTQHQLLTIGTNTYFVSESLAGKVLWRTDTTQAGTIALTPYLSAVDSLIDVDGMLFFFASDDGARTILWKSDGTVVGTTAIKEVPSTFSLPLYAVANGGLFFVAQPEGESELWRSDGTAAGTFRLKHSTQLIGSLQAFNGIVLFDAFDAATGDELWRSDGTLAGTYLMKDITLGAASSAPSFLTNLNGALLFAASDGHSDSLWRTDGTASGTRLVSKVPPPRYDDSLLAIRDGSFYFRVNDQTSGGSELWRTDGTTAGTEMVKHFDPGIFLGPLLALNEELLFFTSGGAPGTDLWNSDGTDAGTVRLKNLATGYAPVGMPVVVGTVMAFGVNSSLWRSDGTDAGTIVLTDLAGNDAPSHLTDAGDTLYFVKPYEVWESDGTAAGTVMLGSTDAFAFSDQTASNGAKFVTAVDSWLEVWSDVGKPARLAIANFQPGAATQGSMPQQLTNVGGTLFFLADDGISGTELWRSDGTSAGTTLVKDINPGPSGSSARHLIAVGNTLFFVANDGTSGFELWKSDGSAAGTVRVKDIHPGSGDSSPEHLTVVGGTLFFNAFDGSSGLELWKSDGSPGGTVRVKDIAPGATGSDPDGFVDVNGKLFFSTGNELWSSDGSESGTNRIADVGPEPVNVEADAKAVVNGVLFFSTGNESSHFNRLWETDGTSAGTVLVKTLATNGYLTMGHFAVFNRMLLFTPYCPYCQGFTSGLWRSDGTAAGTFPLTTTGFVAFNSFAPLGNELFFDGFLSGGEGGLFRIGGMPGPPVVVRRLGLLSYLTEAGNHLLMEGCGRDNDCEVWESDGSVSGTRRLADVRPGPESSEPGPFTAAGPFVFFPATGTEGSTELWAFPLATLGLCGNGRLDAGEECDTGGESATCNADCTLPNCGDGIANHAAGEACDGTSTAAGGCCAPDCKTVAAMGSTCGDQNVCNGMETCGGNGECLAGTPLDCDDGRAETIDDCERGCVHATRCIGDCDDDRAVTVDELVLMVNDALGDTARRCPAGDLNLDFLITIDEILTAVSRALDGCPSPR